MTWRRLGTILSGNVSSKSLRRAQHELDDVVHGRRVAHHEVDQKLFFLATLISGLISRVSPKIGEHFLGLY